MRRRVALISLAVFLVLIGIVAIVLSRQRLRRHRVFHTAPVEKRPAPPTAKPHPDADLLTDHDGEVLRALEHVAAKILALESEEHDRVSFDANGFNVFNHTNFILATAGGQAHNNYTRANFGQAAGTLDPRLLQFGLKVSF